jgi:hypothetical protein
LYFHARKEKGKKNPVELKSIYLREGLLHVSVKIRLWWSEQTACWALDLEIGQ